MPPSFTDSLGDYGPLLFSWAGTAILAVVALVIGFWVVGRITSVVARGLRSREMDPSPQGFLSGGVNILLKAAVFISVASMVGIETTSFVAILGAAGLAVGLALQGESLQLRGRRAHSAVQAVQAVQGGRPDRGQRVHWARQGD